MSRKRIRDLSTVQTISDTQQIAIDAAGFISAGKISVGDLKEYFKPSAINFFDFSSSSTTILTQDVWQPLSASITIGFDRDGLSVNSAGLVTYTGVNKSFRLSAIAALLGQSSRKLHVAFFKNGQLWPCSEFVSIIPSANETTIPTQCVVPMSTGDTIQVYVKCSTHAVTVTLDNLNVIINEF